MRACLPWIGALLFPLVATASPAEQDWIWKLEPSKSYDFEYRSTTDMTMKMSMGMAGDITDRVGIDTDFSLKVNRVMPDGRFDLEIPITRLVIASASGHKTTLDELPPEVRTLRAYMTPKGRFHFYERVMVEVQENGSYGIARLKGDTDAELTVGSGGVEVTARATIDPKTGRATLHHEVRERKSQTRTVEEERPVQHVDVLPADLLALLELPEGPVTPGSNLTVTLPMDMGALRVDGLEPAACGQGRCGQLRMRVGVDSEPMGQAAQMDPGAPGFGGGPAGGTGMGGIPSPDDEPDMLGAIDPMAGPGGMPDLGSMMGGAGASAGPAMKVDVDAKALFDPRAGLMHAIQGRAGTSTSATGVTMTESTTFTLTFTGVR
ncbi:MAG: hypothetical protein EA397_14430 [Deltaproteobacteria bacterium]|nr:MAG: hypothetical protein EA397_14430 [Deltaproteobacteria bacterium]